MGSFGWLLTSSSAVYGFFWMAVVLVSDPRVMVQSGVYVKV